MKKILPLLLLPFLSFTSKTEKTIRLSGYFIIQCFEPGRNCPCGLDIASTDLLSASNVPNTSCLCDGNYYMNFGLVKYVASGQLDESKIDDFSYNVKLQKKECQVFLSTNKNILLDAYTKDSTLFNDSILVKQVESDSATAEMIRKLIDNAHLPFGRMHHWFSVLYKGEMTVVRMKNYRKKEANRGAKLEQYLFLNDPNDTLAFVKIIKS